MVVLLFILCFGGVALYAAGVIKENTLAAGIGSSMVTLAFCFGMDYYEKQNLPSAIDVYRGNTILEITYRDSIPVDSVVVFKEK